MGTRYTFITEVLHSERDAEKIKDLNEQLQIEVSEQGSSHFSFIKVEWGPFVYFAGTNKNLGGGFVEWDHIGRDIGVRVVWIDDEGGHGVYNEVSPSKQ